MWYTRSDAEKALKRTNDYIEKVEIMKTPFLLDGDYDKYMECLELRIQLEGVKAQLEFILKNDLMA